MTESNGEMVWEAVNIARSVRISAISKVPNGGPLLLEMTLCNQMGPVGKTQGRTS